MKQLERLEAALKENKIDYFLDGDEDSVEDFAIIKLKDHKSVELSTVRNEESIFFHFNGGNLMFGFKLPSIDEAINATKNMISEHGAA